MKAINIQGYLFYSKNGADYIKQRNVECHIIVMLKTLLASLFAQQFVPLTWKTRH